jgi:hypothetical protein
MTSERPGLCGCPRVAMASRLAGAEEVIPLARGPDSRV